MNAPPPPDIYPLSLHDALPISLWAPNPEPEPEPEPEPQPEPEPTPVVPASDATQTPAPRREKSVLPNTGDASSVAGVIAAAGTTLVALGLRKKMK